MITSNAAFYKLQIRNPPELKSDPKSWRLLLTGLVEKNQLFTYKDLTGYPSKTAMRTLKCIGDPIGTTQMSNAEWTGVPLPFLLQKAGIKPEAKVVVFSDVLILTTLRSRLPTPCVKIPYWHIR